MPLEMLWWDAGDLPAIEGPAIKIRVTNHVGRSTHDASRRGVSGGSIAVFDTTPCRLTSSNRPRDTQPPLAADQPHVAGPAADSIATRHSIRHIHLTRTIPPAFSPPVEPRPKGALYPLSRLLRKRVGMRVLSCLSDGLMPKMPVPGDDHACSRPIHRLYALLIPHRPAWMDDGTHTRLQQNLRPIRKRENHDHKFIIWIFKTTKRRTAHQ